MSTSATTMALWVLGSAAILLLLGVAIGLWLCERRQEMRVERSVAGWSRGSRGRGGELAPARPAVPTSPTRQLPAPTAARAELPARATVAA